ncbi:MAG: tRNA preQ1(34) S-adenosylmethionine ribosyltransferase-isomerase QueA [Nitrospinae bacterium]|nr:tRNA preQ1(34) S-adenosylmethionine ribosyltransferase-isomerase QueA [Nitrospinota bacterium]
MNISNLDYKLPKELIARYPLKIRDRAMLMVIDKDKGSITHTIFCNITDFLRSTDLLVLNDTKVFPARLIGRKKEGWGKIEILLLKERDKNTWETLIRGRRRSPVGTMIIFEKGELEGRIISQDNDGKVTIEFKYSGDFNEKVERYGYPPIPPYIKRDLQGTITPHSIREIDNEHYQTVYAKHRGAIAAPTAGLHFTKDLLKRIEDMGIEISTITLHIGPGTFRPIRLNNILEHKMESEYYEVDTINAHKINEAKENKRRIIAVGTTTTRVLEHIIKSHGRMIPHSGYTDLFIYPGHRFRCVDTLLTNFHLPRSTLLILVSAFAGRELIMKAYMEAIEKRYRFYSYGDAMLII